MQLAVSGARGACRAHRHRTLLPPSVPRKVCQNVSKRLAAAQSATSVADLAQLDGAPILIALASLLGAGLFVLAFRTWCYGQVEYVTAAMLSRNLTNEATRVVQLGGGTRELFYYPKDTVQVTVFGESLNAGLMEQAGVQALVPVVCRKEPLANVSRLPGSSVDAVVCLSSLRDVGDLRDFFTSVLRVLKPNGRFIFVQPVASGGPSPLQSIAGSSGRTIEYTALEALKKISGFTSVAWDVANEAMDPHAVGIAIKSAQTSTKKEAKRGRTLAS